MVLDELRVNLNSRVGVAEDDTLVLEVFQETVVHDLGLILCTHSSQEFLLGFRYAQSVEGLLDLIRNVVPALLNLVSGTEIVVDVVEVDVCKVASPLGHWAFDEVVVG